MGDGAGVDGFGGEGYAGLEVGDQVGGDEHGGGVEQDYVAAGAGFSGEDCGEDAGVGLSVASPEGFDGSAGEADVFGGNGVVGDDAVVDFGVMAGAGDGELVHANFVWRVTVSGAVGDVVYLAGFAVDYEGVTGVEEGHGLSGEGNKVGGVDSHDLSGGSGGIGERADEVEDGADAQGSADRHDGFHGGMECGGVEEGEAMLAEGAGSFFGRQGDGDAEGFEDVGGAALAGDATIAVFGDGDGGVLCVPGGCGYECCGSGDVEGAGGVGSGAAGVDEGEALGCGEGDGSGGGAHGVDEAGDFFGGFAAGGEGGEECGDFEVGGFAAENGLEGFGGFGAGEGFAVFDDPLEVGLERHCC